MTFTKKKTWKTKTLQETMEKFFPVFYLSRFFTFPGFLFPPFFSFQPPFGTFENMAISGALTFIYAFSFSKSCQIVFTAPRKNVWQKDSFTLERQRPRPSFKSYKKGPQKHPHQLACFYLLFSKNKTFLFLSKSKQVVFIFI